MPTVGRGGPRLVFRRYFAGAPRPTIGNIVGIATAFSFHQAMKLTRVSREPRALSVLEDSLI